MNLKHALLPVMLGILLVACSPSVPSPSDNGTPETVEPTNESDTSESTEPTIVTFWTFKSGPNGEVLEERVAEFNATHSDIQVQVEFQGGVAELTQKILASAATDSLPTLGEIGAGGFADRFMEEEIIIPIENLVRTDEDRALLADVYPSLVKEATVTVNGEAIWASWPFAKSMPVMYYNPELLQEAGIESPATSWEEFAQHLQQITENTDAQAGYAAKIDAMTFYAPTALSYGCQFGPEDFSEATFNDPECVDALRFYQELHNQGYWYQTREYSEPTADLVNGRIAYVIASTAARPSILSSIGGAFELGTVAIPAGPSGAVNTFFGSNLVVFESSPEEQEAAWEFLKWWSSEENAVVWSERTGYFPALRSVAESERIDVVKESNASVAVALEVLADAYAMPNTAAWYEIEPQLIDTLVRVITSDEDPQSAMNEAVEEANEVINEGE